MKLLTKILIGLAGVLLLGLLALVLLTDGIARTAMTASIKAQTGLDAEIGRVEVGLLKPTLKVEKFILHSATNFGSAPMLTIPELSIEYDREAAQRQELHLKLLRIHVSEIQVVEDAQGRTNITGFPGLLAKFQRPKGPVPEGAVQFRGIDQLELSLGSIRFTSLKDPSRNQTLQIGIEREIVRNVTSETNLYPLLIKLALRGGFELLGDPRNVR
jgi:uncharacterized protein involved in outer membrane biogenesis